MKEISNIFYCHICNNINKIQSNFTKSKKLICNNCENVFYYELLFCKKCDKTTYCIKREDDSKLDNIYICVCGQIYNIEKREIYKNKCCFIL